MYSEFGMNMYILLNLEWIANKNLLCSIRNSALCYAAAWMGVGLGRIHAYIHMAESLCCSPETITRLLISYTPIQNKKQIFKCYSEGLMLKLKLQYFGHLMQRVDSLERP